LGASHPDTAQSLSNLGSLYYKIGQSDRAESLYLRSLTIREQQLGMDHLQTAASLNNLALLYESMQRYSEAEQLYRRSIAIREAKLGAEHSTTKKVRRNFEQFLRQRF
jgi:tetratricopeptide (TPR) repeat protein